MRAETLATAAADGPAAHDTLNFSDPLHMFKSFKWALLILTSDRPSSGWRHRWRCCLGHQLQRIVGGGLLALFGVSGADGVIMLEYINQLRARGYSIEMPAIEGALVAARPS